MIVIVLLLSELRGSLCGFSLLTDIEGRRVSLLPSQFLSAGTCLGEMLYWADGGIAVRMQ